LIEMGILGIGTQTTLFIGELLKKPLGEDYIPGRLYIISMDINWITIQQI